MEEESKEVLKISQSFLIDVDVSIKNEGKTKGEYK